MFFGMRSLFQMFRKLIVITCHMFSYTAVLTKEHSSFGKQEKKTFKIRNFRGCSKKIETPK